MKVIGTSVQETWTSATAADETLSIDVSNYAGALITYTKVGTVSAGTIVFEFSDDDGTTWYSVKAARLSTFGTEASYTLTTGSTSWVANVPGATDFRVRLSVQVSGDGSASLRVANLALTTPFPGSGGSGGGDASAANQATIIGHVDGIEGLLTTIDGDTGNISTKIDTIAAAIKAEDAASANGDSGMVIHAIRKVTPANQSGTDGDYEPLQISAGRLWTSTTVTSGSLSSVAECGDVRQGEPSRLNGQIRGIDTVDAPPTADQPVSVGAYADADPTNQAVDTNGDLQYLKTDLNGRLWVTADTNAPVNVAVNGSALTSLQLLDDTVYSDDAGFTPGTSKVLGVGLQADEASIDSVDEGDIGCPRMTLDRKQIVTTQPHSAGGLSTFRSIDLDETEEEIKASAGCVYGMWVTNTATSTRWIKFYNATAASVSVGTTTPVITWGIPGNSSDDISGLFGSGNGIEFTTAITVAATTGVADSDTGAPGANEVIVNIFYK